MARVLAERALARGGAVHSNARRPRGTRAAGARTARATPTRAGWTVTRAGKTRDGVMSVGVVDAAARTRERGVTVAARASRGGGYGGGGGFNIVPVPDRVVALAPYLMPLLSALRYSRFFFAQFPAAIVLLKPLMPLLRGMSTLPMGNLIVFFAIYLGIAKNQNLSRFCRFNAMQAILLDIALIFPSLLESLFGPGILGISLPYVVTMVMHNIIFLVTLAAFALAAVGCMSGSYVRLPIVAEAAEAQMGY